ncbi:elongation factor P 5-aminopentanone reductase [Bacillus smithii]|uniref:elongation factor P 5-aminopentanone reductase n=1 Tax=Bacillus smithii TaxID=1479 RepID=UPI003D218F79
MKKFALITGASGGIGQAAARVLAQNGWNLYLHYHQNRESIQNLMNDLKPYGLEIIPIQADLRTDDGITTLVESLFSVDALVYASGNSYYGLLQDMSTAEVDELLAVHVRSPLLLIRSILPKMSAKRKGQIVLVSSIWGQTGAAYEVAYSAVKGAQIAFVKALSKEVAASGIRVNAVAPGAVATKMVTEQLSEEELSILKEEIPMRRLSAPEEVAEAIAFLLSDQSSYITGQILAVNGGWYT